MSELQKLAMKADRRIKELEEHLDWMVEGLSMIHGEEVKNPKELAANMIRESSHLSDYAMQSAVLMSHSPKPAKS